MRKIEGLSQARAKMTNTTGRELAALDKEAERFREKTLFLLLILRQKRDILL